VGAQRLLPLLQQAYAAWTSIRAGQASLQDSLELLDQPIPDDINHPFALPISFKRCIELKEIAFRYDSKSPYVLKGINLSIIKGSRIGFIGSTGSGKSTLLDIIMGLQQPTSGFMEIDGHPVGSGNFRSWQAHIAHVPQVIFLSDSSIEANIAFGVPKDQINHDRVLQAAQKAKIAETIESWPKKYNTLVGERGIRLSGGQRQRIGIARALYRQADVIIFDEATSSLDNETEEGVMQAIDSLGGELTLLIIAHRLSTLKNCSQIFELGMGGIKRVGRYQ
jgi:ATP-binding cassette subfamily B protein